MHQQLILALGLCMSAGALATPLDPPLRVAVANDLAPAFDEISREFEQQQRQPVAITYGTTATLAKKLAAGAPFDVFASGDAAVSDPAMKAADCEADSRELFARVRLVLWTPGGTRPPKSVTELRGAHFGKVALLDVGGSTDGRAARNLLHRHRLWGRLRSRIRYVKDTRELEELTRAGEVGAAILALSNALIIGGEFLPIEESEQLPIDQVVVICGRDPLRKQAALDFTGFVNSTFGRKILMQHGLLLSGEPLPSPP